MIFKIEAFNQPIKMRPRRVCPDCRGTGLKDQEAILLLERKGKLTQTEIERLICQKFNKGAYSTDGITNINFNINQADLISVIYNRGLLIPCFRCAGKGVDLHNSVIQEG